MAKLIAIYSILWISIANAATMNDPLIQTANIYHHEVSESGAVNDRKLEEYDPENTTKIFKLIIHGHMSSRSDSTLVGIEQAYYDQRLVVVLMADYSKISYSQYSIVRNAVHDLALHFSNIISKFFTKFQLDMGKLHIIGHDLGAHIAGDIGRYFNNSLGRITGLDPPMFLFSPNSDDGLHSTNAQFVDVIHTDVNGFGMLKPCGTADFYPNFGKAVQPGCEAKDSFNSHLCSHKRSTLLFTESILVSGNFPSIPCSLDGIERNNVDRCITDKNLNKTLLTNAINNGSQKLVYMGEHVSKSAAGIYYLPTNGVSPFGTGKNTIL